MKITRTQTLEIEEFGPYRYITRPTDHIILHMDDVPNNLQKLWDFDDYAKTFCYSSDEYMAEYLEGNWSPYLKTETKVDAKKELAAGNYKNLYKGSPGWDGFLRNADGTLVLRKIRCEFWSSYYQIKELETVLRAQPEWSEISIERTPGYNVQICGRNTLRARYLPSQEELNKLLSKAKSSVGGSHGELHEKDYIKSMIKKDESLW